MSHFLNRQRSPNDRSWLSNHTSRSIIFCYFISISFHTFVFYVRCRQNYVFFFENTKKFARNLQLIISPLIIPPLS